MAAWLNYWRARPVAAFALAAGALTLLRIVVLVISEADLGPDEAQYWVWSREPAFGYFSKPPLIAWAIALTTALFGDAEWAVRLAAPLFHLGAAAFLFALARRLYGDAVAFWTGMGWLLLPGVILSAALITTDAPLLMFWAAALYAFFRLVETRGGLGFAALLGAAIGFGALAKYAMIYFPVGAALAAVLTREAREALGWRQIAVAGAIALAIVAPNLAWNAANDFSTLSHTAANANWQGELLHPMKLGEFLIAQPGVFGPIPFLLLVWGLLTLKKRLPESGARWPDLTLLAFALPPLVIVSAQALISRAHANWAAAAFPAALILVTSWALRARRGWAVKAGTALHAAAFVAFSAGIAHFALADAVGASSALRQVRGWEEAGAAVAFAAEGYDSVLVDHREAMGPLIYYAKGAPPFMALNSNSRVNNHYEAFMPLDPARLGRALFVSIEDSPRALEPSFAGARRVGEIAAPLGPGRWRRLYFFEALDYRGEAGGR